MPAILPDSLAALALDTPLIQVCAVSTAMSVAPSGNWLVAPTYALSRKPSGSSATVSAAGATTPDTPGLYVYTTSYTNGPSRTVYIICLSAAAFALKGQSGNAINFVALFTSTLGSWSATTFSTSGCVETSPFGGHGIVPGLLYPGASVSTSLTLNQF